MAKDYARGFYNGKAWRDTQAAYMMSQHYVCERCGGMARIVHHIQYITPQNIHDPNITLSWDNLEALCIDCHNAEHMGKGGACAEGLRFNEQGELVSMQ
jgi:5-methylcytosine-specific restriction endonuclease McrA